MEISLLVTSLLKKSARGDDSLYRQVSAARTQLFEMYKQEMKEVVLRYIKDEEEAAEALMDGFMNCFRDIQYFKYTDGNSLRKWVYRIMVNVCLNRKRKKTIGFLELPENFNPGTDCTPYDGLAAKDLMKLINELPHIYYDVFNLFVFENASHKEIAQRLGIAESTSGSRLKRAKELLQKAVSSIGKTNNYGSGSRV